MRTTTIEASSFCVELSVSPDWASLERLHHAVMSALSAALAEPDLCLTVGMVASELVENAVKYGAWSTPCAASLEVRRRSAVGGDVIEVEVSSPASRRDLEAVTRCIDWIQAFPSTRDAFTARLRSLAGDDAWQGGGLGLLRVAHEGGCELDAWLSQDERILHVKATLPAPP
jgi:hypothetical protein